MTEFNDGWIKWYRKGVCSDVFKGDPYALHLFLYILCETGFKNHTENFDGRMIELNAGEMLFDYKKCIFDTGIKRTTMASRLDKLEKHGMIKREILGKKTVVSVMNWNKYQFVTRTGQSVKRTGEFAKQTAEFAKQNESVRQTNYTSSPNEPVSVVSSYSNKERKKKEEEGIKEVPAAEEVSSSSKMPSPALGGAAQAEVKLNRWGRTPEQQREIDELCARYKSGELDPFADEEEDDES